MSPAPVAFSQQTRLLRLHTSLGPDKLFVRAAD